ncbi:Conserved_hypothetical protein [Hexamita inflata]|uniref:Transmembrane protein n=1 Tax=Hexamita inflata TaxID=28002 RepID=A0ABP1HK32_9EUKA
MTAALLCLICDIDVQRCNFVFIASGEQISGMIIEPKESVIIWQTFVQFRISSTNSSGLTNLIQESSLIFIISQCQLTGSNLILSNNNGYIASTIIANILLNITKFDICVDQTSRFGFDSVQITITGKETVSCDICDSQQVIYGLCGKAIAYSESVSGMYYCVYPFEYIDNQCICAYGYLLNLTKCINVVDAINILSGLVNSSDNQYIKSLEQNIEKLQKQLNIQDLYVSNNITDLENRIISNFSKQDFNLMMNTSTLDNRIFENITSMKIDNLVKYINADTNLLFNTTILDWRIFNNVSQLYNTIQQLTHHLNDINDSLSKQTQIIEQQQNIIQNLTQYINCTRYNGYSIVNGSCIQVSCAILGQERINGVCQCININSIIYAGSCVCPVNSNLVGTACICSVSGQTIQNGQCVCSQYSQLVGNTCVCPNNSQIVNNECVCNLISGLVMHNGTCQCKTSGAFLDNGICTCGINAFNNSNVCQCPAASTLLNNVCTCNRIIGQIMVNGSCQCPYGQFVVNDSCQQTSYILNISGFECSQDIYSQSFDIQDITGYINDSGNFSAGFVFSSAQNIQNAFIDISDNVYSISVQPLFQSQSTFLNLKIQLGVQSLSSGSLITSSSTSISINQMNIISRPQSQLTVSATHQLNMLISSSTSSSITDLLVNLSFAPSNGNISLINKINGVLNISGYQVLGQFMSTGTVTMLGINLITAIVNVNQVCIKPSAYNVGNSSSYLFVDAITTKSIVKINNFAVIFGNSSDNIILCSISTNHQDTNYFLFGGIIANINSASTFSVNNVIFDSYQIFSTNYVSYSGILVGYVQSVSSSINLQNLCLQIITSSAQQLQCFGILGYTYGNTSIYNTSVVFSVQTSTYFYGVGIIGFQHQWSVYAEIINLRVSMSFNSNSGSHVSYIFGIQQAKNCSIQNTTLVGGNIFHFQFVLHRWIQCFILQEYDDSKFYDFVTEYFWIKIYWWLYRFLLCNFIFIFTQFKNSIGALFRLQ